MKKSRKNQMAILLAVFMAIVLGLDAKLFRGEAGTQATIEVTNVKDVSLTLESGEADVTTRAAQGWKLSAASHSCAQPALKCSFTKASTRPRSGGSTRTKRYRYQSVFEIYY